MPFLTFGGVSRPFVYNNQIIHLNTTYKIVLHENEDNLVWSEILKPLGLCSKQTNCKIIFYWEKHDFTLKVFVHANLRIQINVTYICIHKHQKVLVPTLLLVALN